MGLGRTAVIGHDTAIGDGTIIGDDAQVERCISTRLLCLLQ